MPSDYLINTFRNKTSKELKKYTDEPELYREDEVLAAELIINDRKLITKKGKPKYAPVYDETVTFPERPDEGARENTVNKTIFSLISFLSLTYFVFDWDIQFLIICTGVLIVHELGHFLAMKFFNYTDLGIYFIPLLGALATGKKDKISQSQEMLILFAGPIPGILIGIVLGIIGGRIGHPMLIEVGNIFIIINLFNLIPILPLDGGQIIRVLFSDSKGIINALFVLLSAISMGYLAFYLESYVLLAFPVMMLLRLFMLPQIQKVKKEVVNFDIDIHKNFNELTDRDYWVIRDQMGIHMASMAKYIQNGLYAEHKKEHLIMTHMRNVLVPDQAIPLKWPWKITALLFWFCSFFISLVFWVALTQAHEKMN